MSVSSPTTTTEGRKGRDCCCCSIRVVGYILFRLSILICILLVGIYLGSLIACELYQTPYTLDKYYDTLQLPTNASLGQVKQRFYTLVREMHPDKVGINFDSARYDNIWFSYKVLRSFTSSAIGGDLQIRDTVNLELLEASNEEQKVLLDFLMKWRNGGNTVPRSDEDEEDKEEEEDEDESADSNYFGLVGGSVDIFKDENDEVLFSKEKYNEVLSDSPSPSSPSPSPSPPTSASLPEPPEPLPASPSSPSSPSPSQSCPSPSPLTDDSFKGTNKVVLYNKSTQQRVIERFLRLYNMMLSIYNYFFPMT